jgi:hypothetical protein
MKLLHIMVVRTLHGIKEEKTLKNINYKIVILVMLVLLMSLPCYSISIRNASEGARTGAQLNDDPTFSFPLDDGSNNYYTTLAYLLDWFELQTINPTGTWDWSSATVTWGLEAGDIPDISETYWPTSTDLWTEAENTAAAYLNIAGLTARLGVAYDTEAEFTALFAAKAPLDSPAFTGDPTITDATPTVTLQDSDDAAGTAAINANSSGGTNDVVLTFGVEDSTGEGTGYIQLDGVNERVNILKPFNGGPFTISGTDDSLSDEGYAGIVKTGVAGAALAVGDIIYLSDADGKWELADNDSTTAEANTAKGVCVLGADEDAATIILIYGKMRLDSWTWNDNEGQPLYLSSTAGDLTETRPISASEAPQVVAYIESDDEIFVNPQPIDFSRRRIATDADGETLTCLEVQNTTWQVTAAATIVGPALSACPVQDFAIYADVAGAVVYDPNAADDTIIDGTAKGDGVAWTSTSTLGDTITIHTFDTDTLIGRSDGWTAP